MSVMSSPDLIVESAQTASRFCEVLTSALLTCNLQVPEDNLIIEIEVSGANTVGHGFSCQVEVASHWCGGKTQSKFFYRHSSFVAGLGDEKISLVEFGQPLSLPCIANLLFPFPVKE